MINLTISTLMIVLVFLTSNLMAQTNLPEHSPKKIEYSIFWGLIQSKGYSKSNPKVIKEQSQIERQSKKERQLNISEDKEVVSILGGTIQWTRKKKGGQDHE